MENLITSRKKENLISDDNILSSFASLIDLFSQSARKLGEYILVPYRSKANISEVLCKGGTKIYTVKLIFQIKIQILKQYMAKTNYWSVSGRRTEGN